LRGQLETQSLFLPRLVGGFGRPFKAATRHEAKNISLAGEAGRSATEKTESRTPHSYGIFFLRRLFADRAHS